MPTDIRAGELRDALVREIVQRIAPDELPVVAAYALQKPKLVARRLRSRRRRRDPLAFGIEGVANLVAPLVWLAANEAVRRMGENAGDGVSKRLERVVRRLTRRKADERGEPQSPQIIPAFTAEQLAVVHTIAADAVVRHGVEQAPAGLMADSIVAVLALANVPGLVPAPRMTPEAVPRMLETGGGESGGTASEG